MRLLIALLTLSLLALLACTPPEDAGDGIVGVDAEPGPLLPAEESEAFSIVGLKRTAAKGPMVAGTVEDFELVTTGEWTGEVSWSSDFGTLYAEGTSASWLVPNVEQTYKPGFIPIADVAELLQRVDDDLPVYRKNFFRDFEAGAGWSGNNCRRRGEGGPIECRFGVDDAGEPTTVLAADHPLVAGTILFGDIDGANMMSYISTYKEDGVRRKIGLSDSQLRIIRLMTRSPARLMLANYRVP